MASDSGFDIARPTGVCAASGRPIAAGEEYVAVLVETGPEEGFVRRDYSAEAWSGGAVLAEIKRPQCVFGYWRAVMPEPNAPRRQFIDDDALSDLFEQLIEAGADLEAGRAAFRYVLALVLVRKRLLRWEGERDGALLVRWSKSEEGALMTVPNPGMDDARINDATEQLSGILLGEGPR
jgi:hypothetical protein